MVFYFHFRVLSSILSLSFLCSSVSEALFTLSFSYLSERFFFVHRVVEINNTGVTGHSLQPKNDFEHARGLRNSAYAVNLTYETYRHIYTKYSTLPSVISVYIVPKVVIFPEAGGRGKYSLPRVQYMPIFHKEGF